MSSPKQLAKRQKLARKRQRKQESRLRRKQKRRSSSLPGEGIGFDAPGGIKMSDVLGEFVVPFRDLVDGLDAYRRLLTLGVLAWNAALGSESRQQEIVDEFIGEALGTESQEVQASCREIVDRLVERKRANFAQYRRPILDFVLEDLGGGKCHLSVISQLV
jgi:hypothetical protein